VLSVDSLLLLTSHRPDLVHGIMGKWRMGSQQRRRACTSQHI